MPKLRNKSAQCPLRKYRFQPNYVEPTYGDDPTYEPELEMDEGNSEHDEYTVDDWIHLIEDEVGEFLMIHRVMIAPKTPVKDND